MKLDFSTSELLEYARIKFKQVIPILDSNKELCNIHILRTHDDIVSLINRLNQSNFNNNEDLFKYYMIQLIQFGSRNSIKYLRSICDNSMSTTFQIQLLIQTFIKLLNFEGVQFILENLNGKNLELNEKAFKDRFRNRIYISKYSYKDLIDFIQFLIDKFKDCQLSLSNLSLILNYLFLKLIRVNSLTIGQIKKAYQLISHYIEINRSKHNSYYYLKTLSPIIGSCITVGEDPTNGSKRNGPYFNYDIDTSVYTFEYIFKNNNPRINLFFHYFEMELVEKKKINQIKEPFLNFKLLKLIIKTFDLESFIKFDSLLQQHEFNLKRKNHNVVNGEQEDANDSNFFNIKVQFRVLVRPLSIFFVCVMVRPHDS
ncbi:hypothetical protein DDB_G0276487 [Dictyostelium discoideum AX4]|uniref:Uncharacterized protein n=1 Tax=Dictyostelium discoideum TaxID=44689 RepID=Q551P5_DICDI|nr:hypothetical protein DDB_G0276487 [Dictyostelium discoideum AX4]EAL69197.1 hypothetical protein DDB_G0276487 [Dictyostelium discoideum AX4]|eukprot:XP_643094.1 hypothetical protein DDB_G0276487 [Dictyostelium discoideum AX4]